MNRTAKLQFQRLPPEAQRAALWRLAWSGLSVEQMAERTGWSVEQVRRAMDDELPGEVQGQHAANWTNVRQSLPA
jgi:DNA-directed RNA polymerase specialized sigma24 family protein